MKGAPGRDILKWACHILHSIGWARGFIIQRAKPMQHRSISNYLSLWHFHKHLIAISSESKRLHKFLLMWAIVQDCSTKLIAFWRKREGRGRGGGAELIERKFWKKKPFLKTFFSFHFAISNPQRKRDWEQGRELWN